MVASPTQKAPVWYVLMSWGRLLKTLAKICLLELSMVIILIIITLIIVITMTIMIIIIKMSNFRDKNISKR